MVVKTAIAGKYFDVDQPLSGSEAAEFVKAEYIGCGRYIPRTSALVKGNLTALEIQVLLTAGLSIFTVQHCPNPGWQPSAALGLQYAQYGGNYAKAIGYPAGGIIYLDLESPAPTATADDCIAYCKAWFNEIQANGYICGVYCGWGLPLGPQELYDLPFDNYFRAYNGPDVADRGYSMIQETQETLGSIEFDPDIVQPDNKGSLPPFVFNS